MQQGEWKFAGSFLEPVVKQCQQLPCPPEQVRALPKLGCLKVLHAPLSVCPVRLLYLLGCAGAGLTYYVQS